MGQPIRGMTRPLPVSASIVPVVIPPEIITLNSEIKASIHNRFDVEVIDAKSGETKQKLYAENVICNSYWPHIFGCTAFSGSYLHYGTGSGTPSATDTTLFTYAGAKSVSFTAYKDNSAQYHFLGSIQLQETEANVTLTEVGFGFSSSSISTHAMLKDMNGNQISIAKTNTDIINIYATIYLHFNMSNMEGTYIAGSYCTDEKAAMGVAGLGGANWTASGCNKTLRAYSAAGVASIIGYTNYSCTKSPTASDKTVSFAITRIAAAKGNLAGGISKIILSGVNGNYSDSESMDIVVPVTSDWYPGSDIVGEAIGTGDGTTTTFATDFVHATNATIYVDGVMQTGVTVSDSATVTNNIVFSTPPTSGAVITANYHTSVIAKDANHVFDFSITFNFGEYTS